MKYVANRANEEIATIYKSRYCNDGCRVKCKYTVHNDHARALGRSENIVIINTHDCWNYVYSFIFTLAIGSMFKLKFLCDAINTAIDDRPFIS